MAVLKSKKGRDGGKGRGTNVGRRTAPVPHGVMSLQGGRGTGLPPPTVVY